MTMERIPYTYPNTVRKTGIVGKLFITLCSLATIALLIFAGSRDWSSDKPVSAILSDTSDIRNLATKLMQAKAPQKKEDHTASQPEKPASLISNGTLLQQQGSTNDLPAGMVTATAY